MDPNAPKAPGLALPNPTPEGGVVASDTPKAPEGSHEVMMPALEVMPSSNARVAPATPPPAVPINMPVPPPAVPGHDPAAIVPAPVADDTSSDDLDAEWVNKAKAIVEQTKDDPHRESAELSKVKADYLRIRYNKNIKVAEESSR